MVVLLFCFFFFVAIDVVKKRCFKSSSKHPFTYEGISWLTLHEKCQYSELFWSAFSRIRTDSRISRPVSLRSQSTWGKMRTRLIQNAETFYTVSPVRIASIDAIYPLSIKLAQLVNHVLKPHHIL